ncbi:MAG TPA: glycosyltransferase [Gemmatimonadales bacterium]|nr:glycosyltransferase [Gemmatimonadales bacterium]
MRVLILSTSMGMGGADQQILSVTGALRARGWDVRIVSMTALGPMGLQAQRLGIPTESLEMPRGVPDPRGAMRLAALIRSWKPDILHSQLAHANLMARLLRPLVPVPILISTIHSSYDGGRFRLLSYRLTDRLADYTTIISETSAERYLAAGAVPRDRLRVIPNGVDTTRFRPLPEVRGRLRSELGLGETFAWLAVGRFETAKDYPTMLAAFDRVLARRPDAVLLLVGRGSLQQETEELTRSMGLGDRVRFLGVRGDIPELLSAADGYILSSAWEGMPMVLLEAGAAGIPIVATAVGGTGEVVLDGETGFLAPPGNPAALGDAMLRLSDLSPDDRRRLGRRGREHIEARYALPRIVDLWEQMYLELLRQKGRTIPGSAASQGGVVPAGSSGGQR